MTARGALKANPNPDPHRVSEGERSSGSNQLVELIVLVSVFLKKLGESVYLKISCRDQHRCTAHLHPCIPFLMMVGILHLLDGRDGISPLLQPGRKSWILPDSDPCVSLHKGQGWLSRCVGRE